MGVSWTEEQQKVIDLRNRNILVSAAAGSGKTAVLVQRIITMLTDSAHPMDVDELLVVTFTEAAAAEMKERVRAAIEKELTIHPEDDHLLRQATLIHNAQITTIHSFCLSVIRDHFHAINLDPGFRIAEEGELKLLEKDVVSELLEDRYAEGTDRFVDFSLAYARGRSDKTIEDLIVKIYKYSRSYPDPERWLEDCQSLYQISSEEELEKSDLMERTKKQVFALLRDALKLNEKAMNLALSSNGPYMYEQNLDSDRNLIEQILTGKTYRELQSAVSNLKYSTLSRKKDASVDPSKTDAVKKLRDQVKDIIKKVAEKYLSDSVEGILEDLAMCREPLNELISLVQDFAVRFEETKRKQNMIDFSDMEQYAMRILNEKDEDGNFVPSPAAKEYQDHYKEIMIDEYQDSNLIQETILTSISTIRRGRYNIFMVGDVKQSIYRFRLSRPELFMEKFDTYSVTDSLTQRIDLHKNFRSRAEVLESVNQIFERIMIRDLGGIRYDKDAALNPGASYQSFSADALKTELLLFDEDSAEGIELSSKELEAHMIAARIRELKKNHQIQDKKTGELRPVKNSDIVILSRSLSGFDEILNEVLTKEGIPVYVGTRSGYFSAYEVGVMLDYLKVLNNRKQDLPLAAILTSPFGLMTEEELALIKITGGKLPFWKAVEMILSGDLMLEDESAKEKLTKVFSYLDHYREIVPYTPMHELLELIFDETGYMDYVSAMPAGIQRAANLEMLLEKARAFEATSYKGLFHFIRYIDQLQKYEVDYGEASTEDEQSDTVRIMTTHKSKGLEFPVVFVAGMGKRFNFMDAKANVVLHSVYGIGLDAVNLEDRTKRASMVKKMIQREEELETRGEELRILYVALTRAKEKLIMTGTMKNMEKKISDLATSSLNEDQTLPYSVLSFANTYLDWVLPAIWTEDDALYQREIVSAEDVFSDTIQEIIKDKVAKETLLEWGEDHSEENSPYAEAFDQQFGYVYPYEASKNQKLKFTVTELKKRELMRKKFGEAVEEDESEELVKEPPLVPLVPEFLAEKEELTGASRGTAYHRFLELLDYQKDPETITSEEIEAYKKDFLKTGRMSGEMVSCIAPGDVMDFLHTDAAKRMHKASLRKQLFKEQPFVLGIEAGRIYPEAEKEDLVLVQGVIDVYFEEEDGFVILDYKTDKVAKAQELVDRYKAQLDYYGRALEQMCGKKVKEKVIYSITLGEEILVKS